MLIVSNVPVTKACFQRSSRCATIRQPRSYAIPRRDAGRALLAGDADGQNSRMKIASFDENRQL
jgi:hypothetical protein